MKHRLLRFDVAQLLLVCLTYALLHTSGKFYQWFVESAWVRAQWKGQTGELVHTHTHTHTHRARETDTQAPRWPHPRPLPAIQ